MASSAGVSMTVIAADIGDVSERLAAIITLTSKPSRLMKRIGASLESSTKRRFRTNVAPDGTPWKPSVRALRKGGKTLIITGRLRDSITSDGDDEKAVVGTNLVYAGVHQLGSWIKIRHAGAGLRKRAGPVRTQWKMPARPYLGVSEADREEIADQVERYIAQGAA